MRCWGYSGDGQLGYADRRTIGDDELPSSAGPVELGLGRTATAISAGWNHTCAVLDEGSVRCWGSGVNGRLGYGNVIRIGDDETLARPGRSRSAPAAPSRRAQPAFNTPVSGGRRERALLGVRAFGRLGYANQVDIGDDETPGSVGPVQLMPSVPTISAGSYPLDWDAGLQAQAARLRGDRPHI